jgi:hypothetical protein
MRRHLDEDRELTFRVLLMGLTGGYIMALAGTIALSYVVLRLISAEALDRWVAREVPRSLIVIQISVGNFVTWMFVGTLLGAFYLWGDFHEDPGALGSPSLTFTAIALTIAFLPLPPLVLLLRRGWWIWCSMSLLFVVLFGWVLPLAGE